MATYAVIVSKNADTVRRKLAENYDVGKYHETRDGYFFLWDPGLIDTVAEKIGYPG